MPKEKAAPKKGQKTVEVDEQTGTMADAPLGRRIDITQHHVKFVVEKMTFTTKPAKAEELAGLDHDAVEDYLRGGAKLKGKVAHGEYDEQIDVLVDMVRNPAKYPREVEDK